MKGRKITGRQGILILSAIAAACFGLLYFSGNRNEEGLTQKKIGAVYMTMNNPYFEVLNEQISTVVESRGDVMITRDSALDSEMQNRQIEELIEDRVDILLINAIDWKQIKGGLEAASRAGIPVIVVDTEVYDDDYVKGTIHSDNYDAGRICALNLMKQRDAGKILFMIQTNNKAAIDRVQGFKDALDEAGFPYETVGELDCMGQLEIAQPMTEQLLKRRRDIDVVMALNDPSALGAMAALDAENMLKDVLVYSVDGSPEAKTMIYEGRMAATAAQSPLMTGRTVTKYLYDVLGGGPMPKEKIIPVELITKDNIGDYSLTEWQ